MLFKDEHEFSLLPKGTKLLFPSGAVLLVEEYNPPRTVMGARIAAKPDTRTASPTACVDTPKSDLAFRVPAVIDV